MRPFFLARLYLACHEDIYFINKFEFLDNNFPSQYLKEAVVGGVVPSNVIPE